MFDKKRLGLVLSGGGTKGVAHAGVLQFLKEQHLQPDLIACCSAGSIVGCLYAIGKTPEEIVHFFETVYFFNWRHFTFNKPGLVSSKVFRNYLDPIFGEMTIGELDKEVKIVATELVSGEQIVFDNNFKIVDAIIASCSVPGIATPYVMDQKIFCDGGVLNNFPSDVIKKQSDFTIGVFVSPPQEVSIFDLSSIKSIVSRSYDLASYRAESYKFSDCNWFITSKKLSKYGMFESKKEILREIFEIGYEMAKSSYREKLVREFQTI